MKQILKVLVGSRAHGLANSLSDYDYRGVFVIPTSELLKLNTNIKTTSWVEGNREDNTSWEIGQYCKFALLCNPTILETLVAPIEEITEEGQKLRDLFPCFLDTNKIKNAFKGYSRNQRKKMFDKGDGNINYAENRWLKFATAYIRTLYQGSYLLFNGKLPVVMKDKIWGVLMDIKMGRMSKGDIIDLADFYEQQIDKVALQNEHKQDLDKINEFILETRKNNW